VSSRARAIMILGTASDVGKSLVSAALCRIFADRGIDVAPFKAQNMSLEAAVTPEGHEIGRAQALQAEAARRAAHVDMNPILIKPTGDRHAQVIVDGVIWGDVDAWDYHRRRTAELFPRVVDAYERLAARCELVVLEGAGSPAEINLRAGDIVNMRMAAAAGAACILVVDIDRGGAFAALVGTLALLEDDERARVRGFVVNKFRGDVALLMPGIATIEERTGLPCFGVVPWLDDLGLEQEDGYAVRRTSAPWPDDDGSLERRLRVAVVRYPQGANISDIDALAAEPSVAVRNVDEPHALAGADVVILPGSKATLADLAWVRGRELDRAMFAHAATGGFVFGLCGGMQMLGTAIADPLGLEGGGAAAGLGLLPLATSLTATKIVRRVRGAATGAGFAPELAGAAFHGYEIHVGISDAAGTPFARIAPEGSETSTADGAVGGAGRIAGTYVHGILDDDRFRHAVVAAWRRGRGLAPAVRWSDHGAARDARLDRWSRHVAAHLDVDAIAALG
jgi:adenosylcobyric acid synthase